MGMSETNSKLMLLYSLNFLAFFTARSCLHFFFLNFKWCCVSECIFLLLPPLHKCLFKAKKPLFFFFFNCKRVVRRREKEEEMASTPGPRSDLLILGFLPVPDEA